jgi:hypothetical protein
MALGAAGTLAQTSLSAAAFSGSTANTGPSWAAGTLQPPTGVTATGTCVGGGGITTVAYVNADLKSKVIALTVPASAVAGDLLLVHVVNDSTSTPPAGFAELQATIGAGNFEGRVYQRLATAADAGTTYTWSMGAAKGTGGMLVLRGAAGLVASGDAAGTDTGKATVLTAPALNVATPGSVLFSLYGLKQPKQTFSTPPGMTPVWTAGTTGATQGAFQELRASVGATGTRTTTASTNAESVAQSVLVAPAGSPAIDVSWTPSSSSYASGYVITRDGTQVATITPVSASTWRDTTMTAGTHTYAVRTTAGTWRSTAGTATGATTC